MGKKHATAPEPAPPVADLEVFRAAVRDVKPLKHKPKVAPQAAPKARRARRKHSDHLDGLEQSMPLLPVRDRDGEASVEDKAAANAALSYHRAGVRTQVMRHLKRGLYPVESELDLHGMSQSAARLRLAEFLVYGREAGWRCVRIVHGKGYRSGARGPILKTAVDTWLRRHADVMAFTSARTIDGGTGAVYVLLRA
jgi:DNA-nicking Smr family endonuclease